MMVDIPEKIVHSGLLQAWKQLAALQPRDVCQRTGADFESSKGQYLLRCLGQEIRISPGAYLMHAESEIGDYLVRDMSELFQLPALWYLLQAKNVPCSQRLIRPEELPGGDMFSSGSHVLPLHKISARFGTRPQYLLESALRLQANQLDFADAAIKLWPLPRMPITLVLWAEDEEFPANTSLLLDSTAGLHLPVDTLWSAAMCCILLLLRITED